MTRGAMILLSGWGGGGQRLDVSSIFSSTFVYAISGLCTCLKHCLHEGFVPLASL